MSEQTNACSLGAGTLYVRGARDVAPREPTNLAEPPGYIPLLVWTKLEPERSGNKGDQYGFYGIEELLLFDGGTGLGGPGLDFTTAFEKNRALGKYLQVTTLFVGASLCRH